FRRPSWLGPTAAMSHRDRIDRVSDGLISFVACAITKATAMSARSYIIDDRERKTFLLDREVLVSEDILRQEMSHIFGRCWIYVGHASELKKPGDFRSRKVAGRPVIFCRDQKSE